MAPALALVVALPDCAAAALPDEDTLDACVALVLPDGAIVGVVGDCALEDTDDAVDETVAEEIDDLCYLKISLQSMSLVKYLQMLSSRSC